MKWPLLGLASAVVRSWTRLYTWRMPPALRDARRAEIDSDLWEFQQEAGWRRGLVPAVQVLARMIIGVRDDLGWRVEQAAFGDKTPQKTVALTATAAGGALFLLALWVIASDATHKDTTRSASPATPAVAEQEMEEVMRNDVPDSLRRLRAGILAVVAPAMVSVLYDVPLQAQSSAAGPSSPAFEAASVKPNHSGPGLARFSFEAGGRVTAINMPLRQILLVAFRVQDFQLLGGPSWLTDRFDIVAKAEGNPPVDQLQSMIQTLLRDRLKLATHAETRDLPVYALTVSRSDRRLGESLRRSGPDCAPLVLPAGVPPPPPPPPPGAALPPRAAGDSADPNRLGSRCPGGGSLPGFMTVRAVTIGQFANQLARWLGRPVIDRTTLSGEFDVDLRYTPDQTLTGPGGPVIAPDPNAPSVFTAVQEQLGLKLESTRGPVDVVVIDHVEQPTEN